MRTLVSLALFASMLSVWSQDALPIGIDIPTGSIHYDPAFPKPSSVLQREVGERHTRPEQIVRWFDLVARSSSRVLVRRHGYTHEQRPLIHAIVTSKENHARLEEIRRQNLRLSDAPEDLSDTELQTMPAVVWLGYGVHGNEASAPEAAILTLYHLAAGRGEELDHLLQNTIILIDPDLNPDGHDRFCDWVNGQSGRIATADPQDREHREPWPGGRTNHYLFDLNRDWLCAVHPESRARLALWHRWRPHLSLDFHEMGSERSYFFQPGIPIRNNPLTPSRVYDLTGKIAQYHARALDEVSQPYYTKDSYDDYFFGKGSTYPDINGSVGILFEQGSARARRRKTARGELSYAKTIRNQLICSLSSLRAAVDLRSEILANQRRFYREAPAFARKQKTRAWFFPNGGQRQRVARLCELLLRHRIVVHEGSVGKEEGLLVPVDQPQARLVQALLAPVRSFPDTLFYDVSTWALPLAFGLRHRRIESDPKALRGQRLLQAPSWAGWVDEGGAAQGWLLLWDHLEAPKALIALHKAKVVTRLLCAPLEFERDGESIAFAPGTVLIPKDQPERTTRELVHLFRDIAKRTGARFLGVPKGLALRGPDIGSPSFRALEPLKVALLCGTGCSPYRVGEVWHLLNEEMGLPLSLLDTRDLAGLDLRDYQVLILPPGRLSTLGSKLRATIDDYISAGGCVIATQNAASWLLESKLVKDKLRLFTPPPTRDLPYADLARARGEQRIGGAIFEATLDPTHPLAFGIGKSIPLFRSDPTCLERPQGSGVLVGRYARDAWLSGYASRERRKQIEGSAALIARRVGKGRVILFADNPIFRGFWLGGNRLFMNAVLFNRCF